jgi:pSer/pThr/pTyr-binding forkhead associated (FHA) protein
MFKADGGRRSFSLPRAVTLIGRREDCDLRIPLGEVSRKHCRFIIDNDMLRLEDLGSSNGTYHNGVRVREAIIQPGDAVRVGPVTFVVQIDGVPEEDSIHPPANNVTEHDTSIAAALPAADGGPPEMHRGDEDAALAHLQAADAETHDTDEDDLDDVNLEESSDQSKPSP